MERNETEKEESFAESEADIVEMGGETTAAATTNAADESNARPVGADTRVKVAGEQDSGEEK